MNLFWQKNIGATESIRIFEQNTNRILPADYKEFLSWSNGGQGKFPNIYLDLWKIEDICSRSSDYQIATYLGRKFIPFGSDGGAICFLFDYRIETKPKVVSNNFGDLDLNEILFISDTFSQFLKLAITGELIDDDL